MDWGGWIGQPVREIGLVIRTSDPDTGACQEDRPRTFVEANANDFEPSAYLEHVYVDA